MPKGKKTFGQNEYIAEGTLGHPVSRISVKNVTGLTASPLDVHLTLNRNGEKI